MDSDAPDNVRLDVVQGASGDSRTSKDTPDKAERKDNRSRSRRPLNGAKSDVPRIENV
jgi:hypothetical protein